MYQQTVLDSGLRVATSNMPHARSASIGIFIATGSRYEPEPLGGISHFIEHMLFKGTKRRPTSRQLSEAIEGVGGMLNGGTDKEITLYWCKVARPHCSLALDVLSDMLINSSFNPAEIEKERQVIIEEINMSKDSPSQEAATLIDELLWPGHALGRDTAGSRESVTAITGDMMLDYMSGHYHPANTLVSIAGNIEHDEMVADVKRILGKWDGRRPCADYLPYVEKPGKRVRIETRDNEQVNLCLGLPGLPLLHPRRFTLDLLNTILGEGMSGRLFTEIRDNLGLAYSINSYTDHFRDTGAMIISAGVETGNLRVAVRAILAELTKLKTDRIPEHEITKARELSKGRLLLRMEDSRSVAAWLGAQGVLTGRILSVDEVVDIIDAITADELQEMAGEILTGENLHLAVVGPVSKDENLEELLKI
ncbi:M16 family metallopeptidase [Chloroflexota bacterium]